MEKTVILKFIGNTILFDFIKSIDNNVKSFKDVKIKRSKNMVLFLIEPEKQIKHETYHSVDKIFRFFDDKCFFEYGCINLDFSKHWQKYYENLESIEI